MASVNGSNIVRMLSLVFPLSDAFEVVSAEEIQLFENIKHSIHGADESRTGDEGGALILWTEDSDESGTESDSEQKKAKFADDFYYRIQKLKNKNIPRHRTSDLQTAIPARYRLC